MVNRILFYLLILVFFACENKPTTTLDSLNLSLVCTPQNGDFLVNLNLNGQQHHLANISACENFSKADYKNHEIPQNAIDACGGSINGTGEYFFIEKKLNGRYAIMYGQMYEQKETGKYDYTQLAEVKKDDSNQFAFFPKHDKKSLAGVYTLQGPETSWMLILQTKDENIHAEYYEVVGQLPSVDELAQALKEKVKPTLTLKNFDVDFSDMVINSDLGNGQYEAIFGRERITFFDKKSHQEDVLRLTKDDSYQRVLK